MTGPLFTVIIPTFDRPQLLAEAVASVLSQSIGDLECLVVDDASSAPLTLTNDPRVRVVRRASSGGGAAARNTGIRHARGRYMTFLDDDDLYTPERLALAIEGLSRAPVAICWSRFLDLANRGNRRLEAGVRDVILDGTTPALGATAADRSVVPLFDERFGAVEDVEWWLRLASVAKVTTVPRVGYLIRRHAGPRHHNGFVERIRGSFLLLETHRDYFATHPRAAAFRWRRIGFLATSIHEYALARKALRRAFRLQPDLADLYRYVRALRVSDPTASEPSIPGA
jgi:glycosyltransferase involved in cell wall biosynthesis